MTFTVTAHYSSEIGPAQPLNIRVFAYADTVEAAKAVVANFPKSLNLRAGPLSGAPGKTGYIGLHVALLPTKGNTRNEGGIKRYLSFRKAAAKLGHTVTFEPTRSINCYANEADLMAAIA